MQTLIWQPSSAVWSCTATSGHWENSDPVWFKMQQTPLQCLMTWLDCCNNTLWGSAQSFDLGGHGRQFSRDSLPVFSTGDPCDQFWHGQGCPLFDVVHPAFSLPTTASSTLQGALKNGFGEAVVVCDMPEPCKFPSLDSCQKVFLWTHKEVDHAPHPVVGLVLQIRRCREVSSGTWFQKPRSFFSESASRVHVSQP